MLPGVAPAGAGLALPIVLRDLGRSATLSAQYGGSIALPARRAPGSQLAGNSSGQGNTSTFYTVDSSAASINVSGPSGSGKQPGDVEGFAVIETLDGAVGSPRTSFVTVTYT